MKTIILFPLLVAAASAFAPSFQSRAFSSSLFSEEPTKEPTVEATPEAVTPAVAVKPPVEGTPSVEVVATTETATEEATKEPVKAPVKPGSQQVEYGQSLPLPDTYVRCGGCQSHFALTEEDLGDRGKGRRLECCVCGNTWFQSKERIMNLRERMELVDLPEHDLERIKLNKEEGKPAGFIGDSKLYVGNVAFECTTADMYEEFGTCGSVGDVAMVYDNETGRPRGFAFVTMRTKEGCDKALAELNGKDIMGRQISVREANN